MIVDLYHPGLPYLCLLWKSAPNILWSVGSVAHSQLLQVRKDNLLVMLRVSLMLLFADRAAKQRPSRQPAAELDYRAPQ
jgi:hypothetical protein